jgi:hypothetical protein
MSGTSLVVEGVSKTYSRGGLLAGTASRPSTM